MLRMFARDVGDNTNILPIATLRADIAAGNLPSVTFIDPAMHNAPENDDHPVADMLYGQIFLKSIYDELRANEALWLRTLLIISYDEHGGFYDHVVPPTAEIRALPGVNTLAATLDFKAALTTPYGVRVPAFVVSPWVAPGKGPDITLAHCSIMKNDPRAVLRGHKAVPERSRHSGMCFPTAQATAADYGIASIRQPCGSSIATIWKPRVMGLT